MGSISKSHIVNQASEAELQKLFPLTHFIVRPLKPDYHIDYLVELNQENEPSGICFYVQLKGVGNIRFTKDKIKCSIKTKHLNYYLDKVKVYPVFLLITDTSKNRTYWLFIQKYLDESISNSKWRNQKTVTLSITKENLIADLVLFQNIVREANTYMVELWPSSIEAAVKKEKEYFRSLDPRFNEITVTIDKDNSCNYHFHSDDKFDLNFKVKTSLDLNGLLNDPNSDKILLKSSEVDVEGSPLMKELLLKSDQVELKIKKPAITVDIYLTCINEQDLQFIHLVGEPKYNNELLSFRCTQPASPLVINIDLDIASIEHPKFNFEFDFNYWINIPIQSLPYLDNYFNYFSKISSTSQTRLKIEHKGDTFLLANTILEKQLDFVSKTKQKFELFKKLRIIDFHFKLELLCPDLSKLTYDDFADIEELYNLITIGEHQETKRKLTGSFEIIKNDGFLELYEKGIDIRLVSDGSYKFLGKDINISEHFIDISSPVLLISYEEMEKIYTSSKKSITLKFTTDKSSKVFIRMLPKITEAK